MINFFRRNNEQLHRREKETEQEFRSSEPFNKAHALQETQQNFRTLRLFLEVRFNSAQVEKRLCNAFVQANIIATNECLCFLAFNYMRIDHFNVLRYSLKNCLLQMTLF